MNSANWMILWPQMMSPVGGGFLSRGFGPAMFSGGLKMVAALYNFMENISPDVKKNNNRTHTKPFSDTIRYYQLYFVWLCWRRLSRSLKTNPDFVLKLTCRLKDPSF